MCNTRYMVFVFFLEFFLAVKENVQEQHLYEKEQRLFVCRGVEGATGGH
jgi:hypothetical protein